jgi:amino acid transporter
LSRDERPGGGSEGGRPRGGRFSVRRGRDVPPGDEPERPEDRPAPDERAERESPPPPAPGAPSGRGSVPQRSELADIETTEIVRGAKPGSRFARRVRVGERRFEHGIEEATYRATDLATAPRTPAQRFWRNVRRVAIGSPIATEHEEEQKLPKKKALAVFSSDALSSSAYATDQLLLVLAVAAALTYSVPIAIAIVTLLAIVSWSYRQTNRAYPNGGGAYVVARENFGDAAGLTAAAGLSVGYIMTAAVSVAAGVVAVTSAVPELSDYRVHVGVGAVAIITLLNLRGIRESGTIFAIPTYGFIVAFVVLIVGGFVRLALDPGMTAPTPEDAQELGAAGVTVFLVLRAFAAGCTALTGVEAISTSVPSFRRPESQNASTTLVIMAIILGTFFLGITILANELEIRQAESASVPAQIARTVFGENVVFYAIQTFTALILFLAANTAYAAFPRLASVLARDKFLPHQFLFRGDRLAFSNGIIVLGAATAFLLVIFDANVNRLVPLYALGVFLSFTLSQGGMVVHWLRVRDPGWRRNLVINGVGCTVTAVVAIIIGVTRFLDGAWISMVSIAVLAVVLWFIYQHYIGVQRRLDIPREPMFGSARGQRQLVLVPVDQVNRATLHTVDYARTLSQNVRALHVTDEPEAGHRLREEWESVVLDVPLIVIDSPYRSFVAPVVSYVDLLDRNDPTQYVTVVLPEYMTPWPWQKWLHNQSARRLRHALLERPHTAVVEVPYHLR